MDFTISERRRDGIRRYKEFQLLEEILKASKPAVARQPRRELGENGCTMFDKIFRASHFYDWQGVLHRLRSRSSLRMGPPHIPREILWLDSVYNATPAAQPVIFRQSLPAERRFKQLPGSSSDLKTRNTQAVLADTCVNRSYDADGISGVIGRSSSDGKTR